MSYKISFWSLLLASTVLFFVPFSVQESAGLGLDKVVHIILFASLFYLGIKTYREKRLLLLFLLVIYAVVVEFIQGEYLIFRSFDVLDIGADLVGLIVVQVVLKR